MDEPERPGERPGAPSIAPHSHADGRRIVSSSFRHVRPHPTGFELRFRDEEALDALEELRVYRRAWAERLEAARAELAALAGPSPRRRGLPLLEAVRALGARPSAEVVRLRYQVEDLQRTVDNIDSAVVRLEEYVAGRTGPAGGARPGGRQ